MPPVLLEQVLVARARQLRAREIIPIALPAAHVRRLALAVLVRQQDPVDLVVLVAPEAVAPVVPVAPAEYVLDLPHVRALMACVPAVLLVQVALVDQVAHVPSRQAEVQGPVLPVAAHPLQAEHPAAHLAEVPVAPAVEVPVAAAPQVLSVSKVASRAKRVRVRRYVAKSSTTCLRQNSVESSSLVVMDLPRFEWHVELR